MADTRQQRRKLPAGARWKVLERDGFECRYCGATPLNGVILHVDHVLPVSEGGTNAPENLVTACRDCNLGKGAKVIKGSRPVDYGQTSVALRERVEQVKRYRKYLSEVSAAEAALEQTVLDEVAKRFFGCERRFSAQDRKSVLRFVGQLGAIETIKAAGKANAHVTVAEHQPAWAIENRFRYFCGICWREIRARQGDVTT